jgi:hypothetical protein
MESISPFLSLPVEPVHYILDFVKPKDILSSFGNVCRRFRTITDSYDRLSIRWSHQWSKTEIQSMCRVMRPENVISLILKKSHAQFNPKWPFFMLYLYLRTEPTLTSWLFQISNTKPLISESINLLSTIMTLLSLCHLTLNVDRQITYRISWSKQCSIYKLRLQTCTYERLCSFLKQLPNLRILMMHECILQDIDESVQQIACPQLTSLTFNDTGMSIDKLEYLLLLFPSLLNFELQTKGCRSPDFL